MRSSIDRRNCAKESAVDNDQAGRSGRRFVVLALALLALAACQTVPQQTAGTQPAETGVRREAPANAVRYAVLPDRSEVRFLVYRSGPLARLGHNHVILAKNIRGEIALASDFSQSTFSLSLPVKDFVVDENPARAVEGEAFAVQPDADAVAATTENMLSDKVLDAERYPTVEIESIAVVGPTWGADVRIRIALHGQSREMSVPTAIDMRGDELIATAFLAINQTDFGITPISVLGGGLQVDNAVRVRIRIVAAKK
jgi:hypothetical protein